MICNAKTNNIKLSIKNTAISEQRPAWIDPGCEHHHCLKQTDHTKHRCHICGREWDENDERPKFEPKYRIGQNVNGHIICEIRERYNYYDYNVGTPENPSWRTVEWVGVHYIC